MKDFLKLFFWALFSPKGRMNKKQATRYLSILLLSILPLYFFLEHDSAFRLELSGAPRIVEWYILILAYVGYMIMTKRCHDVGYSFLSIVSKHPLSFPSILGKDGVKGPNKYGPDPLEKNKKSNN